MYSTHESLCMSVNSYSLRIIMYNWFFVFQYYEMSYGLNIEMHKQVSELQASFLSLTVSLYLSLALSSLLPYTPSALHYSLGLLLTAFFLLPQSALLKVTIFK